MLLICFIEKKSALFASQKITFDIGSIASELICDGKHAEWK